MAAIFSRLLVVALICAGCAKPRTPVPTAANATSAPSLAGLSVLLVPVQSGPIPSADSTMRHWPVDRAALEAEIAYWLKQTAGSRWFGPDLIDRALQRSPGLDIRPRELAVGSFYRAQVKRIGDPLFGDLRRLAAVFDAQIAVVPVAAEFVGKTRETARLNIATAIIALDADVKWFGIIEGSEAGVGEQGAIASAAQAFVRAFAGRKTTETNDK
jgi:hypothetical protein